MAEWTQASDELTLATHGKGFTEITRDLSRWLESIPERPLDPVRAAHLGLTHHSRER